LFDAKNFINKSVDEIRVKVKDGGVVGACSGGVDSTVVATLVRKAIGDRLLAVFIDDGLRREGEPRHAVKVLKELGMRVRLTDAKREFFQALKGVTDAEEKRKVFRHEFYSVLGRVIKDEGARYLAQGTIAADIVETVRGIKTQQNVLEQIGIDPKTYGFELIEPLKELYKPQVRAVARELNLPKEVSERMPFPGPGLCVRVLGEVTKERIDIIRKATEIVEEETKNLEAFQSFAVLYGDRATGIKDGKRVYGNIIAVRAVESADAITAKAMEIPYETLKRISEKITGEIPEVVRVCYDVTDKPPGTIEYE